MSNGNGNRFLPWLIGLLFPALVGAGAGLLNNLRQYEGRISALASQNREIVRRLEAIDQKLDRRVERRP